MAASMYVDRVGATEFRREEVPEGFEEPPKIAVILPGHLYSGFLDKQEHRSYDYHLLRSKAYEFYNPVAFDADPFVEEAIAYCRENGVHAVLAFDSFPALLASAVREALGLRGPTFKSVLLCSNKYYMRRHLTPEHPAHGMCVPPLEYPVVVKMSDTQFYIAVRICANAEEWQRAKAELMDGPLGRGLEERQKFYLKWATRFGFALEDRWEDVVLVHTEPHLGYRSEHQCEVVVDGSGKLSVADTGDIVHMDGGDAITLFKTPSDVEHTPAFRQFLEDKVGRLAAHGYLHAAADVEYVRLLGAEERYQLVEVNSRYSYMGFLQKVPASMRNDAHTEKREPTEIRNLLNRTRLALGASPMTMPCLNEPGVSKIAAFVYTERSGPIDDFFDKKALQTLVENGEIDAWIPKPPFLAGRVDATDLAFYHGWAKVGVLLMTWRNDKRLIDQRLDEIMKSLFFHKDRGWLPAHTFQEQCGVDPQLKDDTRQQRVPRIAVDVASTEEVASTSCKPQVCAACTMS